MSGFGGMLGALDIRVEMENDKMVVSFRTGCVRHEYVCVYNTAVLCVCVCMCQPQRLDTAPQQPVLSLDLIAKAQAAITKHTTQCIYTSLNRARWWWRTFVRPNTRRRSMECKLRRVERVRECHFEISFFNSLRLCR